MPDPQPVISRGAAIAQALLLKKLGGLYAHAMACAPGASVFDKLLNELQVRLAVADEELARVPVSGPVVIVANHPFGMLEGAVLGAICRRVRPDVRIMANSLLACREGLEEYFIFVDPYGHQQSKKANRVPMRHSIEWLRNGGALIVFPAGDVSYPDWRRRAAADPAWNPTVSRIIRLGQADALPVFFHGSNSAGFHLLGMVHPRLRTLRIPSEFLNKRGQTIHFRIGRPISQARLQAMTDEEMIDHLRARTYLLAHRPAPPRPETSTAAVEAVQVCSETVGRLIDSLPESNTLLDTKDWRVICFQAGQAPELLEEIGRLREETFRAAGEGTGRARDVDGYDLYYDQLILWSKKTREIAGGYRLGRCSAILERYGTRGLYTSSLFRFQPGFFERVGPAVELGRSFVCRAWQKQFSPLLLLWQGIGAYIVRHPECRFLFGAVSVSAEYELLSRQILVSALLSAASDPQLTPLVVPRRPLRPVCFPSIGEDWKRLVIRDVEDLSALVEELESDGKGLPVLIRQYLRLGGRLLGFSVDPAFSNVLDGLILVDLLRTEPVLLERYLGKAGAAAFRRHHASGSPPPDTPSIHTAATQS